LLPQSDTFRYALKLICDVIYKYIGISSSGAIIKQPNLYFTARNEVFRRMFENKEMKEGKDGQVEISDISINAMEWFLRYVYTGIVMSESEDAEEEQRFFQLLPEIAYIADKVVQLPYNNNLI